MPEQFSLEGVDAARAATDRLFFGIFPDAAAAARIAQLARQLSDERGLRGKPLATERFHVTLHHVGDYYGGLPAAIVPAARAAGEAIALPQFELAFDRAGSFAGSAGNRPFVLRGEDGLSALAAFRQSLGTMMVKSGLKILEPSFTPHLTLLYDKRLVPLQPVETIAWTVREFLLVHSLLGRTEYRILGRWPLPA